MNYILFLDESGDHGLAKIDSGFPVFVLCGVLFSEENYTRFRSSVNVVKEAFWADKKVILHSRDIRKCEKEFQILLDYDTKARFYSELNTIMVEQDYRIIAAAIDKQAHIKKYGRLATGPYEIALSFIIERAIFYLDSIYAKDKTLSIVIEKRGKKEDEALKSHFLKLKSLGTYYVTPERLASYEVGIEFKDKKDNINGLQLSDLVAYPIARYVMDKERANPAFDVIVPKFYTRAGKWLGVGLKIFP